MAQRTIHHCGHLLGAHFGGGLAAASATRMYVSATPTDSAVNFYSRPGCVLAGPPHQALFDREPEDIVRLQDIQSLY